MTWLLARRGGWGVVLALLVAPPLFAVSAGGNVQPLMLLALLIGFDRRWGPVAVAIAASMKFTPILLVAAYVARREWWKAGLSVVLAAVLLAPGLFMGITGAGVQSGAAPSLLGVSPVLYAAAVGARAARHPPRCRAGSRSSAPPRPRSSPSRGCSCTTSPCCPSARPGRGAGDAGGAGGRLPRSIARPAHGIAAALSPGDQSSSAPHEPHRPAGLTLIRRRSIAQTARATRLPLGPVD